jgi:hypothetical protein
MTDIADNIEDFYFNAPFESIIRYIHGRPMLLKAPTDR